MSIHSSQKKAIPLALVVKNSIITLEPQSPHERKVIMSKNILEQILDPEDDSPITLFSETGEMVQFEQIALIYLGEDPYLLARPLSDVGLGEDEALVFGIFQDETGDFGLEVVDDDDIVDQVFEEYYALLRESGVDPDEE